MTDPHVRRLDPVVDAVADEVIERIADLVDHPLVELRLLARQLQPDPLVELPGDVPDGPLEPVEEGADRDHARVEDAALEAVRDPRELIDRHGEFVEGQTTLLPEPDLLIELTELLGEHPHDGPAVAALRSHPRRDVLGIALSQQVAQRVDGARQTAGQPGLLERGRELAGELGEPRPADDELPHEVEQDVEPFDVHADGFRQRWTALRDRVGIARRGGRVRHDTRCRTGRIAGGIVGPTLDGIRRAGRRRPGGPRVRIDLLHVDALDALDACRRDDGRSIGSASQDRLESGEVGTIGECLARGLEIDEIALRRQTGEDQFDLHFRKRKPGAQGDGDAPMPRGRRGGRPRGTLRLTRRGRVGEGDRSGWLRDLVAARVG